MTDHGGIIREALNTWCHAQHGGPVCEVCDEIDNALASLDALEAELKEAEKANIEWQKQIDYAQERAEAAEAVLRKIASGTHLVDHFYEGPKCRCGQQFARAALSEDRE